MVAQPSYKRSDEFEQSINTLEQYYILKTLLYEPLFDSLVTLPQPIREKIGGRARINRIAQNNYLRQNQQSVQRSTNVISFLQARDTNDRVNKTQTIVTSIETKEDNLRRKLDEGLQNINNRLDDLYIKIIDWFSELGLDDFLNKFNDIHRIIKLFDGTQETDFFPKFNKIHDIIKDLKITLNDLKMDALDKLNPLSGLIDELSEKINNGFLLVGEIFKTLNDFVRNFNKKIKPKIININTKINSLTDAAQTLKDELDKLLTKIKSIKKIRIL